MAQIDMESRIVRMRFDPNDVNGTSFVSIHLENRKVLRFSLTVDHMRGMVEMLQKQIAFHESCSRSQPPIP